MPLLPGSSKDIIAENIREMRKAGHPEKQAVAAAMHHAKGKKKKKGKKFPKKVAMPKSSDGEHEED